MSARRVPAQPQAIDVWQRRPVYRARIVQSDTPAAVVVKPGRPLKVGRRITFARVADLNRRMDEWRSAVIWRIDKGCLHLTRT